MRRADSPRSGPKAMSRTRRQLAFSSTVAKHTTRALTATYLSFSLQHLYARHPFSAPCRIHCFGLHLARVPLQPIAVVVGGRGPQCQSHRLTTVVRTLQPYDALLIPAYLNFVSDRLFTCLETYAICAVTISSSRARSRPAGPAGITVTGADKYTRPWLRIAKPRPRTWGHQTHNQISPP